MTFIPVRDDPTAAFEVGSRVESTTELGHVFKTEPFVGIGTIYRHSTNLGLLVYPDHFRKAGNEPRWCHDSDLQIANESRTNTDYSVYGTRVSTDRVLRLLDILGRSMKTNEAAMEVRDLAQTIEEHARRLGRSEPSKLDDDWADFLTGMPGTEEQRKRGLAYYIHKFRTKAEEWFR